MRAAGGARQRRVAPTTTLRPAHGRRGPRARPPRASSSSERGSTGHGANHASARPCMRSAVDQVTRECQLSSERCVACQIALGRCRRCREDSVTGFVTGAPPVPLDRCGASRAGSANNRLIERLALCPARATGYAARRENSAEWWGRDSASASLSSPHGRGGRDTEAYGPPDGLGISAPGGASTQSGPGALCCVVDFHRFGLWMSLLRLHATCALVASKACRWRVLAGPGARPALPHACTKGWTVWSQIATPAAADHGTRLHRVPYFTSLR